ncbi:bifunctional phosphopantothenoylcysteine decarboxylase/phosphopantothenate--cysteine ligase CoaBC [Sphingomonadaceae bacterium G21617-S1]|jgi:phosphopantothenoylcysteine decarboxylase/phosphopantothenate--cysteine ligase|uniref:bifunctional phosphopantothenoylcysteine decarboxylase/phosphopantothenate--cysteine ligase CoaBC n=1 Tax=Rhizorhabdus sp. TaxID=1968843 RepID=UPI0019846BC9|nr:bifunctional phosphopantothenoylcysteine decarboxylase/phosphopantothenate--cysteine ligase CoaBC [Rhizorhabdus sp.]MBD3761551.1 bifunctional phosphopantothenoylcysteine decarboxylase/phosphopantothenate--cysteine ligase CoaBC [Rhizorhabdus sp.]MCZ4340943.1 bifunctional phosphopantothenoylcysteine decarboxylase/phosphopantothenate--cysteine ligase CoaBC [Sphingomonadaceae bacterium G21617-S1]
MIAPRILLIIGGGIAAYKACELVRLIRKGGGSVRCVLTQGAQHFVTPMSLAALSEQEVHTSLWDLKNETEMGHIQLSREADLVVVCPATADLMAKMAAGIADDLATTLLLATDKPVLAVPAMNVRMWLHPATQRNVARLREDGVIVLDPDEGAMACGEFGPGRLPEPPFIWSEIEKLLDRPRIAPAAGIKGGALAGRHVVVTAGPTHEPIDPVRYIANRSSGKQGYAIAGALAALGARVTLISGPVGLPTPAAVHRVDVESARDMAAAVEAALPADIAVMVAAVADWRADTAAGQKIKKDGSGAPPSLALTENPDILAGLATNPRRPRLLIGFAAETEKVIDHAVAKRARKGADWIVANDVSGDVMGGDSNSIHIVTPDGVESWETMPKADVAHRLAARIADEFA